MGDLRTNTYQESGKYTCHGQNGLLDLVLDPSGDLALITDPLEQLLQEIRIWSGTKLGERIDPRLGCVLHDYSFAKMTASELENLRLDLEHNFLVNFPEFSGIKISCGMYTNKIVRISAKLGILGASFLVDDASLSVYNYQIASRIGIHRGPVIE